MKNYTDWISYIVAAITALVYGVKVWDDLLHPEEGENGEKAEVPNKATIIRNCLYSAFGSGIVCLLVCEGLIWQFDAPFGVAVLAGAMCGFIGADKFKDVIVKAISFKFGGFGR